MTKVIETTESNDGSPTKIRRTKVIENSDYLDPTDLLLAKIYQIIWFVLALVEILIGLRIVLKILGASSFSPFASFIYTLSSPFISPFNGILRASFGPNGQILEWSSILAIIVYAIVAWVIVYLLQVIHPIHLNHVNEEELVG